MSKKRYSQRMYLFFCYGILITFVLCLFFTYFYIFYRSNTYSDTQAKSESLCASIENSVYTELQNMSTISMNIVYSNAIKKNFVNFSTSQAQGGAQIEDFSASRDSALTIYDIITSIIGPFQSASQVNLYTLNGICIGSGYFQRVTNVNFDNLPWFPETIARNGTKYISTPTVHNELPAGGDNQYIHKFISLTRVFFNSKGEQEGIVEVIQDCNRIFSLISELKQNNPTTSFYVYNERDELVYPYENPKEHTDNYIDIINKNKIKASNGKMIQLNASTKALICYRDIEAFGWTVVTSEPEHSVYQSLQSFKISFIIIITCSILFTLGLCFIISSRLTYPLRKLTNVTKKVTINRVLNSDKTMITSVDSSIKEISQLCESFRDMYDKLRDSSTEILLLKSEEIRAKLAATQSLINPHFLYNNLTSISIMAEEDMNEDIIKICHSLCDYFRYITSNDETAVPLEQEILYTEKYMDCMKMRYEDDFIYECTIKKETKGILIPKLILQPIVENAFKYAFDNAPPWHLNISSYLQDNNWIMSIEDNGGCLSDERREELLCEFLALDKKEELKSLKIGGMGLKSVYLRLQLLYGKQSIFNIDNTIPGKTIFVIGGPIHRSKEVFYEQHPQI